MSNLMTFNGGELAADICCTRFGTAAVVRGLKEAAEDPKIGAVVLRIDSGGGGVVESDTIWGAVRDLREKHGKTIVASFGNASASGGYLVSTRMS